MANSSVRRRRFSANGLGHHRHDRPG
jgi:hypothetical protein